MLAEPNVMYRKFLPYERRVMLYGTAFDLHQKGYGVHRIERQLRLAYGYSVDATSMSRWIYHGAKPESGANVPDLRPSPSLSYFLGAFHGDGFKHHVKSVNKYLIGIRVRDRDFAEAFSSALGSAFGRLPLPCRKVRGNGGPDDISYTVVYTSRPLRRFLRPRPRECIGPYVYMPKPSVIEGRTIVPTRKMYRVSITRVKESRKFAGVVGFTITRKITRLPGALDLTESYWNKKASVTWYGSAEREGMPS